MTDKSKPYILIDGSNLYIGSRRSKEWQKSPTRFNKAGFPFDFPVEPNLAAVEAVVAHCRDNGYQFKLYFDGTARFHFEDWAMYRGNPSKGILPGCDLRARFAALTALGASRIQQVAGVEADMILLADAAALLEQGIQTFIVTGDKFRDRQNQYPELLQVGERDRPVRCLEFRSAVIGEIEQLVFPRFPVDGEMKELRLRVLAHAADKPAQPVPPRSREDDRGYSGREHSTPKMPVPGPSDGLQQEKTVARHDRDPAKSKPTRIVERSASMRVDMLYLYGSSTAYRTSLEQAALSAIHRPRWPITIGRSDDCDFIVLETLDAVSRRQVQFRKDSAGNVFVVDLGSANGTWLDGQRLLPNVPTALPPGAGLLSFVGPKDEPDLAVSLFYEYSPTVETHGSHTSDLNAKIRDLAELDRDAESSRITPSVSTVAPDLPASNQVIVNIQLAGGRRLKCPIKSVPFTIGTKPSGQGFSLDFPEVVTVSREHITFTQFLGDRGEHGVLVKPIGRNGTYLDGVPQSAPFILPLSGEVAQQQRSGHLVTRGPGRRISSCLGFPQFNLSDYVDTDP